MCIRKRILQLILCIAVILMVVSCNDYLDRPPLSDITPEEYLWDESQLASYAISRYTSVFPTHERNKWGTFEIDGNTDNQAAVSMDNKYAPGMWRVGNTGGDWDFSFIYQCNYFLETVLSRISNEQMSETDNIRHYIGEMYFLRAYEYFRKLQTLGDFPIVTMVLPDEMEALTEASKRMPRNEVARFILSDLEKAAEYLKETSPDGKKNRISRLCTYLMISRVALFEATWLKYFKGTAFVPNGNGWPGKTKDYNASYQYPSGSIDNEINFFFEKSMVAAKVVADAVKLVENTGIIESPGNENPYYNMFAAVDLSGFTEILLWRKYDKGLGITHNVSVFGQHNNNGSGTTRGMTESFLMANGLPIYAEGSGYQGDDFIADVRKDRDGRLHLFLKEPGQINVLLNPDMGSHTTPVEPVPGIYFASTTRYNTGYTLRKGASYDGAQCDNNGGYSGSIIFRATEAYLNYIEACYEKNGTLDADATAYWRAIRMRGGVDPDFNKTIAATEMSKETLDWGAYSAGVLIAPTLYNIRRERRNELMAEGLRYMDIKRWRALDQLITTPYHIEGFKLWGPMKEWYDDNVLVYGADNPNSVVSDPALSQYLRPYELSNKSISFEGCKWTMAHYLSPIATQHFEITSIGSEDYSTSPIYQNPGWKIEPGSAPDGF